MFSFEFDWEVGRETALYMRLLLLPGSSQLGKAILCSFTLEYILHLFP